MCSLHICVAGAAETRLINGSDTGTDLAPVLVGLTQARARNGSGKSANETDDSEDSNSNDILYEGSGSDDALVIVTDRPLSRDRRRRKRAVPRSRSGQHRDGQEIVANDDDVRSFQLNPVPYVPRRLPSFFTQLKIFWQRKVTVMLRFWVVYATDLILVFIGAAFLGALYIDATLVCTSQFDGKDVYCMISLKFRTTHNYSDPSDAGLCTLFLARCVLISALDILASGP